MKGLMAIPLVMTALVGAGEVSPSCATGTVTASVKSYYIVSCGEYHFDVYKERISGLLPGDLVRLPLDSRGRPCAVGGGGQPVLVRIGHTDLPPAPLVNLRNVDPAKYDKRRVRLRGWVKNAARDPLDDLWMRLVLKDGSDAIDVAVPIPSETPFDPARFQYATVELTGVYQRKIQGGRQFATASIEMSDARDIRILASPGDPFDQPSVETLAGKTANEILFANACTCSGTVYAVWGHRSFLLQPRAHNTASLVQVDLADPATLPQTGARAEAVGLVQTDLHHIRLTDARWRALSTADTPVPPPDRPEIREIRSVLTGGDSDVYALGAIVRATGLVREVVLSGPHAGELKLASGDLVLRADLSALGRLPDGLADGARIELTAVAIAETDPWRPGETLANYRGMTLVPQTADDVRILSRAPWWTPTRLLLVILTLAAGLVGIAVWNRMLSTLARRRGHELFRSEYARTVALLRVGERTRLATELHDSLSQSISGIACQVAAALRALVENPATAKDRLEAAGNMLSSCRSELSNCLFDLRGDMLEENDFGTAIRKSLALVAGAAEHASIRVNIPRARIHDSTAHAILCIVRELVSNALRHGRAERVRVAGCIDGGHILFSVTDNGTGFDAKSCLGPDRGHFGLTGIRDRVHRLKGTVEIESVSPHGTRVAVALPLPTDTTRHPTFS